MTVYKILIFQLNLIFIIIITTIIIHFNSKNENNALPLII